MMLEWLDALPVFLLVLVRMSAFFVVAPIFSLSGVPNSFKIGTAFFIALISFTTITVDANIVFDVAYIMHVIKEAVVGLSLGFIAALLLYTVQVAGGFIDFQMGFLIANLVDPQTGAQIPVIGNFKYIITILFMLSVNGHHLLLQGVIRSYQLVPVEAMFVPIGSESVAMFVTYIFAQMFLIAFQIAVPIAGSLFLIEVSLGILARTVPQVNVFVVGLPLKIFAGLCIILITLPGFMFMIHGLLREMIEAMGQFLHILGG